MKETGLTGKRRSTTIAATPDDGNSQRKRRRRTKKYKTACVQEVQLGDLVYQHRPSKNDKLVVNN